MAELYFFVTKEKIGDIIDCGLKLSEWYDRVLSIPGIVDNKKVIKAFLNPRDHQEALRNSDYECLRLDVDLEYCKVADGFLYAMGLDNPEFMKRYYNSMVPLQDYCFGTFRDPEVLVMASILPEFIEVTGKALDIPLLYESSEVLYLVNRMEKHEELYKDSGNHLLYAFFTFLESKGKVTRFEDKYQKNAIFVHSDSQEYIVLRIP